MRSSVKMKTSGRKKSGATFFGENVFSPAMGPWWDRARADKLFTVIIISRPYYGLVSLHFFSVAVVSEIQRNTATNFQRKTGNIWSSNIATAGELQKTSTCVICGSNFNPRLLLCKIVEKDALLSLWLPYWLYRQARQVSSSTLLVKVEREKWISQQQ